MRSNARNRVIVLAAGMALVAGNTPALGAPAPTMVPTAAIAAVPMAEGDVVSYTSPKHTFTLDDVIGNELGETEATNPDVIRNGSDGETLSEDSEADLIAKDNGVLHPINSTFGFDVQDFEGATQKTFDDIAEEGWVGEFSDDDGDGLQFSNADTAKMKSLNLVGTWAAGLGGNQVKASTEHFTVMEAILTCNQTIPYDYWESFEDWDAELPSVPDAQAIDCAQFALPDPLEEPVATAIGELVPNEDNIVPNPTDLYLGTNYSVTQKDDGKVLYRWGQAVKRPTDIRFTAHLPLPEEWATAQGKGFKVTKAELMLKHAVTNNPNDQIRPEDWENEGATGLLPEYAEAADGTWESTKDCYEGDGDFIPEGTLLKDPSLGTEGSPSSDLSDGFSAAWYTTIDRDPFAWSYEDGPSSGPADDLGALRSGPRWRMMSNKFGQDIPGLEIPAITCDPPPYEKGTKKYEVGEVVETTINLLDWSKDPEEARWLNEDDSVDAQSPFAYSAGWMTTWSGQDTVDGQKILAEDAERCTTVSAEAGDCVTSLGTALTDDFDVTFYVKGDKKPLKVYDVQIVLDYEGGTPPPTGALDFGDAPATYSTALVSRTVGDAYLGATVDAEPAPQAPMDGTGDDVSGRDDEDGVTIPDLLPVGHSVDIGIEYSRVGVLDAQFDWNADGDFDDDGELVAEGATSPNLQVTVPDDAVVGASFARFVLTTDPNVGEVEDYPIVIGGYDFGDLPPAYFDKADQAAADEGGVDPARHMTSSLSMKTVDAEAEPQGNVDATGDDNAGIDDEDGVGLSKFVRGKNSTIRVSATEAGYLRGWIDWNADGDFADDELVIENMTKDKDGTKAFKVPVPDAAELGPTFARFRVSTVDAEIATPFGAASDGEVEDHMITISGKK